MHLVNLRVCKITLLLISMLNYGYCYSQANTDWRIGSFIETGFDSLKVSEMEGRILDSTYQNIHSVLIVKDQKLVYEKYFQGYKYDYRAEGLKGELIQFDKETTHNTASATKSVTGLLVGLAIDKGFIEDSNSKIFSFFPAYSKLNDSVKERITVANLLTMRSGLKWNEQDVFYTEAENDIVQLFITSDPIEFILSKPTIHEPGTNWYYNGGGTNLLGEIIHQSSQLKLDEFGEMYLFEPLGIDGYEWGSIKPDLIYASGDMKLKPRDMAKLGQLVLDEGKWNGNQVVSSKWIREMTEHSVVFSQTSGYAYHWWVQTYKSGSENIISIYADGWGGQRIMVFPTINMVVVFTGGNYFEQPPLDEIVSKYILPSLN
jgi:CubicO group peptidase (beta-lactamase class C family)